MSALPIEDTFLEIVEQLDEPFPCECYWHRDDSDSPAEWIVWRTKMCCRPACAVLWCNDCLVRVLAYDGTLTCKACGTRGIPAPKHFIIQYEKLTP